VKCERVREIAADALDGLLSPEDADAFHGHLAHCRACVFFYERLREAVALLEELPEVEVQPDFNERVWARLAEERAPAYGIAETLSVWRERVAAWWGNLTPAVAARRWSLAAVTAAVVAMLAISAEPPLPFLTDRAGEAAPGTASQVVAAASAPQAGRPVSNVRRDHVVRVSPRTPAANVAREEEVSADMPEAVEAFLRNSRELRLTNGDDRYRRANYTYPLRRFPEVSPLLMVEEEIPGSGLGARPTADQGTAVIAF
jgi:hypothetical protein